MPVSKKNLVALGHFAGAHGIHGAVLVRTYTEQPENIAAYGPLCDDDGTRQFTISVVRVTAKGVIARIESVSDRNGAEALKGVMLYAPRDALPEPDDGEWYVQDLAGLAAISRDGRRLGEVVAVQNYGAGDLLELRLDGARQSELIPFDEACVLDVDIKAGRVVVAMPGEVVGEPTGDAKEPRDR